MQLPQHIIDLVGTLLDEGWSDEEICNAAVLAMKSAKAMPIDYPVCSTYTGICAPFGRRLYSSHLKKRGQTASNG